MRVRVSILILGVLLGAGVVCAQEDDYIELLRSDLKTEKKAIITEAMGFTSEESAAFWPVYREYELELSRQADSRLALIKDFAKNYDNMSDAKAKELLEQSMDLHQQRFKLRKKYVKRFEKVLPPKKVARFYQVEQQIFLLTDLQIGMNLPLVQ